MHRIGKLGFGDFLPRLHRLIAGIATSFSGNPGCLRIPAGCAHAKAKHASKHTSLAYAFARRSIGVDVLGYLLATLGNGFLSRFAKRTKNSVASTRCTGLAGISEHGRLNRSAMRNKGAGHQVHDERLGESTVAVVANQPIFDGFIVISPKHRLDAAKIFLFAKLADRHGFQGFLHVLSVQRTGHAALQGQVRPKLPCGGSQRTHGSGDAFGCCATRCHLASNFSSLSKGVRGIGCQELRGIPSAIYVLKSFGLRLLARRHRLPFALCACVNQFRELSYRAWLFHMKRALDGLASCRRHAFDDFAQRAVLHGSVPGVHRKPGQARRTHAHTRTKSVLLILQELGERAARIRRDHGRPSPVIRRFFAVAKGLAVYRLKVIPPVPARRWLRRLRFKVIPPVRHPWRLLIQFGICITFPFGSFTQVPGGGLDASVVTSIGSSCVCPADRACPPPGRLGLNFWPMM